VSSYYDVSSYYYYYYYYHTHIGSAIDKEEFYAIYGEMLKVRKKEGKKKEKAPLELKSYGMLYYFTSGARIDERTRILRNI
jgi:hypothetical protein